MMNEIMEKTGVAALKQAIPDEMQNCVISIGVRSSADKFTIGDIANSMKAIVREHGVDASVKDVYRFIAMLTSEDMSARLVEFYSGIALFCDYNMREKYDVLTFSHFAYARTWGDYAEKVLEFMMNYFSAYQRPPSVAWVENNFRNSTLYSGGEEIVECPFGDDMPDLPCYEDDQDIESVQSAVLRGAVAEAKMAVTRLLEQSRISSRAQELARELLYELDRIE